MYSTKYKTTKTIKKYSVKYNGWDITVPIGSIVSNQTACGHDDNYRFWINWNKDGYIDKLTGNKNSILAHDLTYYGINIPEEYCEPYTK